MQLASQIQVLNVVRRFRDAKWIDSYAEAMEGKDKVISKKQWGRVVESICFVMGGDSGQRRARLDLQKLRKIFKEAVQSCSSHTKQSGCLRFIASASL